MSSGIQLDSSGVDSVVGKILQAFCREQVLAATSPMLSQDVSPPKKAALGVLRGAIIKSSHDMDYNCWDLTGLDIWRSWPKARNEIGSRV